MKRLSLAVVLSIAGAFFLPVAVHAQSNLSSIESDRKEEKRIRELYNAFEDAWNAHKVDQMADKWALDGDHQEPDGHIAKGREDVRALFAKQHESVFKNTVLDLSIDAVWFITSDVALVEGTYSVAGAIAPDGNELPARQGHLTAVLLKENDTWNIAASRLMIPIQLPYKPKAAAPAPE